jgi:hypothetical protein
MTMRVRFPAGTDFSLCQCVQTGPTQSSLQFVQGVLSSGEWWPVHEADHSPPSSAKVKNAWSYTSPICLYGMVLY